VKVRSPTQKLPVDWPITQRESLDLAGRRFRQVIRKVDPARIFPRTDGALHIHLDFLVQRALSRLLLLLEHNKGTRLDRSVIVFRRNNGRFKKNTFVRDKCGFDLKRRYPDAADLEHIVRPTNINVDAVRTPDVLAIDAGPLPLERSPRTLEPVQVADGRRMPAHQQFVVLDVSTSVIDETEVVTSHGNARRALFDRTRNIGEK
jgi:hypothetical protein